MKYKVLILGDTNLSNGHIGAPFMFYTRSQAELCCNEWIQQSGAVTNGYRAFLWDGSRWTLYEPIP